MAKQKPKFKVGDKVQLKKQFIPTPPLFSNKTMTVNEVHTERGSLGKRFYYYFEGRVTPISEHWLKKVKPVESPLTKYQVNVAKDIREYSTYEVELTETEAEILDSDDDDSVELFRKLEYAGRLTDIPALADLGGCDEENFSIVSMETVESSTTPPPAPTPAVSGNLPEPEAAEAYEVWRIAKWRRRMGQVPSSRITEYVPEKVATLHSKSEAVLFIIGKRKLEDDTVEYGIYHAYKPGEFPDSQSSPEVREVIWQGYKIESELDEDGNYILAIRFNGLDGEVIESVGLTPGQVEYLFSIHKQATQATQATQESGVTQP